MNFIEREAADTKVTILPREMPYILIDTDALQKMFTYTAECSQEIGWLGTAYKKDFFYHITDVFLFGQEVHSTTTEITPEGLAEFGNEILQREDGVEVWNNLKVWGHSHVNMGITPSAQDDKQMQEFEGVGHDWFIRLICNKKGELSVDLYDYDGGLVYKNVSWERYMTQEEENIYAQISMLKRQLGEFATVGIEEKLPIIKAEMELKVKKKTYATPTYARTNVTAYGRWVNNVWRSWTQFEPTPQEMVDHEALIPVHVWNNAVDKYAEKKGTGAGSESVGPISQIHEDEDVYKFFNADELAVLSFCNSTAQLSSDMADYNYEGIFSSADLAKIFIVAQREGELQAWGTRGYGAYGVDIH